MKEKKEDSRIDLARAFLGAAIRRLEAIGIYIESVRIKRNEDGSLKSIVLSYEDREIL